MATSMTAGYNWGRPTVATQPPDTASSAYPDRPIRPLPKRRLRSRLSSEQADSIVYPPVLPSSSPAYGSPASLSERDFAEPKYLQDPHNARARAHEHVCECGEQHSGFESDEDEDEHELPLHRSSWSGRLTKYPRGNTSTQPYQPPPPNSSTSSADGYESFENTSNKKKRKTPISNGTPGLLASDFETSAGRQDAVYLEGARVGGSHGGNSGRSRSVRPTTRAAVTTERRPLSNTYANGVYPDKSAISHAHSYEKDAVPAVSLSGQENASPLQRQKPARNAPQGFTFECKSDSSDKMALVQPPPPPPPAMLPQPPANQASARGKAAAAPPPPPPKARPSKKEVLEKQARHRKRTQEIENFHHPSSFGQSEDNWVCYMCEYEGWFGEPPKLFTRKYEEKDFQRRKAKRIALKKLEQAKAKSRKGKKSKAGIKSASAAGANSHANSQPYDPASEYPPHEDGSQGDEFFDDDDYDDAVPGSTPFEQQDPRLDVPLGGSYPSRGGAGDGFPGLDRTQSLPNM